MSQYNKLKIAWACRRGMLELDFMIMPFYQERFEQLSAAQKDTFIELLSYTDPELFRWLMNQQTAPTVALADMVKLIQDHLSGK
ncbi:antitoxin CptB [Pasteurella testudinis DSM 23072]|uniref:FAD assembly factor SdhE n=1 Tax=Pasteurella testudinis DSM 23072 TaxID=1122938 RepID=A0A1W1UGA1_9PAST|nr:succinate dehydrogenase assembly factor 2 [Pasteurella testudinis]SMB79831.1 antitoxin CptB [Pasteurella testudinis DSM 23072]SUB50663.1 TPR repeat protein [Pasteurella testudinis]